MVVIDSGFRPNGDLGPVTTEPFVYYSDDHGNTSLVLSFIQVNSVPKNRIARSELSRWIKVTQSERERWPVMKSTAVNACRCAAS